MARLRILATSDLHMQIAAFDYARDRVKKAGSLAKLATLIKAARKEAAQSGIPCLLVDNGDTLQGSPLAELLAQRSDKMQHPMVACMNLLQYDACGLGNHDFDHGLDYLNACIAQHRTAILCTNLESDIVKNLRRSVTITRPADPAQQDGPDIRIGILSTVPQKTALWNRYHLGEQVTLDAPLPVLEREAARLRAEGVDLVVVLAHMGLPLFNEGEDTQNQVEAVAALDDVDVVIGGHTHLRFPGPDHAGIAVADCTKGMVHGKPVVQPGPAGSDLGLIDLRLARTATGRWSVAESDVSLRPVSRKTAEDQAVIAQIAEAHKDTRRYLSRPVGRLKKPINSFFALAHPSPVPALMAAAKRRAIARAAANSPLEKLPLLSVASAPLTGGFDGPDNFLDLAAGPIHLRHLAGMNPYSNNVWAVQTTGAQLVDWLERSALIFNTLEAGNPDQLLINPAVPGFRYDTIYGLSYHIDPREPPLFDMMGRSIHGNQGRIKNVLWQGKPLANDQQFLVATTDHRVGGSGIFKTFDNADIVIQGHAPLQDTLMDYLKNADCAEVRTAQPWTFAPGLDRQAILLTAPEAIHSLADIAHLQPEVCGETDDGFLRVRLRL